MTLKYEIRRLVWELPYQDRSTMMVLLALADYINDDGVCWPGAPTAAVKARVAIRTFYAVVKRAVGDAILVRIRPCGNHRTNRYRFCLEGLRRFCQTQGVVADSMQSAAGAPLQRLVQNETANVPVVAVDRADVRTQTYQEPDSSESINELWKRAIESAVNEGTIRKGDLHWLKPTRVRVAGQSLIAEVPTADFLRTVSQLLPAIQASLSKLGYHFQEIALRTSAAPQSVVGKGEGSQ